MKKEDNKINCHSRVFLSGISTLYPSPVAAEVRSGLYSSPLAGEGRGFTLLELIITIIIIAVLAAIALSAYQKAVWRARSIELKNYVQLVAQAERAYYLTHGRWGNFKELDISLSLKLSNEGTNTGYILESACTLAVAGKNMILEGNGYRLVLNSTNLSSGVNVVAVWTKGPYKCAGFRQFLRSSNNTSGLGCTVRWNWNDFEKAKKFCTQIEHASFKEHNEGGWELYTLP